MASGLVRFRLAATFFSLVRKEGKSTLRGENPGSTSASKGRKPRSQDFPPKDPIFTGAQDRVMHRPPSGVGVSRRSLLLISAAALLAVVATAGPSGHACSQRSFD